MQRQSFVSPPARALNEEDACTFQGAVHPKCREPLGLSYTMYPLVAMWVDDAAEVINERGCALHGQLPWRQSTARCAVSSLLHNLLAAWYPRPRAMTHWRRGATGPRRFSVPWPAAGAHPTECLCRVLKKLAGPLSDWGAGSVEHWAA
ncbi:hypothetical protein NDU88_001074 [Pleurodeles waltl]|uniref:Uncharacterized protein n=1 Tax=Pleurodeles waltl TaxID=8319 RepID=A0AAV7KZS3_PLEWA|nr:hypothetical protein NDU88_001074 [Pleurodeles waltl]